MRWPPKNEAEAMWGRAGLAQVVWPQHVTALSPSPSRLIGKWGSLLLACLLLGNTVRIEGGNGSVCITDIVTVFLKLCSI